MEHPVFFCGFEIFYTDSRVNENQLYKSYTLSEKIFQSVHNFLKIPRPKSPPWRFLEYLSCEYALFIQVIYQPIKNSLLTLVYLEVICRGRAAQLDATLFVLHPLTILHEKYVFH